MMKKLFLASIISISIFAVNAQEFEGGIQAGLTASQVQGDITSGYNKAGFYAGGYVNRTISDYSVLQMELNYIQKGSRQTPTEQNGYESYKLNLHYVELPLLYKLLLTEQFALEAGLAYGVFITKKELYNGSEAIAETPFNRHNLFFVGGLYYNINEDLRVSVRTNNSITPIRPHYSGVSRLFNEGQYSDLLSLGLQFTL